jgi:hypothetical protein
MSPREQQRISDSFALGKAKPPRDNPKATREANFTEWYVERLVSQTPN